jgi:hypothetical protein
VSDEADPRVDLGVGAVIVAVAGAVLVESRKIPPGVFEPLGSGPVPQVTAALIIGLCLIAMVQAWRRLLRAEPSPAMADTVRPRHLDAAVVIALTVIYVVTLQARLADFSILTLVYLTCVIGLLVRFAPRRMPAVILTAAAMGFGCQYVFTRIFVVDLPGL